MIVFLIIVAVIIFIFGAVINEAREDDAQVSPPWKFVFVKQANMISR